MKVSEVKKNNWSICHWYLYLFTFFIMCSFFNFYFYFILLYNTVLVLPYIDMNPPRVNMSSQYPPTPYHLSGSSPCTSPKHPVSSIKHRPVIHFLHDSIHVSVPFSQIIPPSLSPSESKSPLYTSVSFLRPRGMLWGGRWEGGSCLGSHVHLWWIHVNV